jgi:hypothetical protein
MAESSLEVRVLVLALGLDRFSAASVLRMIYFDPVQVQVACSSENQIE